MPQTKVWVRSRQDYVLDEQWLTVVETCLKTSRTTLVYINKLQPRWKRFIQSYFRASNALKGLRMKIKELLFDIFPSVLRQEGPVIITRIDCCEDQGQLKTCEWHFHLFFSHQQGVCSCSCWSFSFFCKICCANSIF